MRTTFSRIQRLLVFCCGVIILNVCLNGCTPGGVPSREVEGPFDEQPENVISDDEHPPEEPQSGGEAHIMNFTAHRAELHQGECTVLEWHVQGGYSVHINGQPVGFEGTMDICPGEKTTYSLEVDGGDSIVDSQVTIHVQGSSQPGDGDAPPEPPDPPATQGSPPSTNPPQNKAPETPGNCNKTATEFITDLAITDIYAGSSPKGQFWVRITNNGPVACQNVNLQSLSCTVAFTPKSGQSGSAVSANPPVILNIGPGETQNVPTGLELDLDKASYMVTCTLGGMFGVQDYTDINPSNHQFVRENFP